MYLSHISCQFRWIQVLNIYMLFNTLNINPSNLIGPRIVSCSSTFSYHQRVVSNKRLNAADSSTMRHIFEDIFQLYSEVDHLVKFPENSSVLSVLKSLLRMKTFQILPTYLLQAVVPLRFAVCLRFLTHGLFCS